MINLLHIITGLNTGGAENMLYKLLFQIDKEEFSSGVISLTDIGPVGKKIVNLGIEVNALDMRRGFPDPRAIIRLANIIRQKRPSLIQTWMYHADLVGGLSGRMASKTPVLWGIRHSNLDSEGNKKTTIMVAKACARFSRYLPAKIVCCSQASREVHQGMGYVAEKMVVIPNGFDLSAYRHDPGARESVCRELKVSGDVLLIGIVGRYHPQKDYRNFIEAAALLIRDNPSAHYLLCGDGVTWENEELGKWIREKGMEQKFFLLGRRDDIPRIMSALDIFTSSSAYGEGFPNVIGEAMACQVPCVVTGVGDSALIVGDTGRVVSPGNAGELAGAWQELIQRGPEFRRQAGLSARKRVLEKFNLPDIVKRYEDLYRDVAFGLKT